MDQGSPKELVKAHGNAELRKRAKDAQEEINGTKEPTSNVIRSPNDHIESLREE